MIASVAPTTKLATKTKFNIKTLFANAKDRVVSFVSGLFSVNATLANAVPVPA